MIIDIKMYENQIRLGRVKMLPEDFPDAQTHLARVLLPVITFCGRDEVPPHTD